MNTLEIITHFFSSRRQHRLAPQGQHNHQHQHQHQHNNRPGSPSIPEGAQLSPSDRVLLNNDNNEHNGFVQIEYRPLTYAEALKSSLNNANRSLGTSELSLLESGQEELEALKKKECEISRLKKLKQEELELEMLKLDALDFEYHLRLILNEKIHRQIKAQYARENKKKGKKLYLTKQRLRAVNHPHF